MNTDNAIEVKDVYKKFKNYFDKNRSLKEKVLSHNSRQHDYWVLKGMDFYVQKGEAVGLVGRNGCGKSTCLKLLTKIIYPDKGSIQVNGRVSSLLELGAGFHPDLSGMENIYLNASVFGLNRREIENRLDEIVRFSELEEFIHHPIRTYSSGMYMKLAFSVAINVDADILLIDEILGVGDVSYQKKCFEKLLDIRKSGTTIVIVSHAVNQIEKICDRSIWIENGKNRLEGVPKEVHKYYLATMEEGRLRQKRKEDEQRRHKMEQEQEEFAERRQEIQNRKRKQDHARQKESTGQKNGVPDVQQLLRQEEMEIHFQRKMEEIANKKRQEQQVVCDKYIKKEILQQDQILQFYKNEAERLQLVIDEKEAEAGRLNSVIRQRDIRIQREQQLSEEERQRLERIIFQKDEEIGRIDLAVLQKDEEIARLNHVIAEKEERINGLIFTAGADCCQTDSEL